MESARDVARGAVDFHLARARAYGDLVSAKILDEFGPLPRARATLAASELARTLFQPLRDLLARLGVPRDEYAAALDPAEECLSDRICVLLTGAAGGAGLA